MNCPKCGYERQSRDDAFVPPGECPACGLVYAKHDPGKEPTEAAQPMPVPHLKPSPVDALSLRKARERVEKRLREKLGSRVKDEHHAQTLELAKRLTAEQVRKRQDEWEQAHADKPVSSLDTDQAAGKDPHEEFHALTDDQEPATPDEVSPDLAADPVADEISTSAEAAIPETDATPAPVVEYLSDSTQDMETDSEAASEQEEEPLPDDETARDSMDASFAAAVDETHPATQPPPADPEPVNPESQDALPAPEIAAGTATRQVTTGSGDGIARLLPVVAWLILSAGVIGAVLSWTTIGGVEAGTSLPTGAGAHSLPLGLLLGFAYLATGVLGFAFFWVSSLISTQLKDIYRLLMAGGHNENDLQDETA
jgi:hypothetical protein